MDVGGLLYTYTKCQSKTIYTHNIGPNTPIWFPTFKIEILQFFELLKHILKIKPCPNLAFFILLEVFR